MTGPAPTVDPTLLDRMRRIRRGLDPQQVAELLAEANRRIEQMQAQRDMANEENSRLKNALRNWQTEQFQGPDSQRPAPRPLRDNEPPVLPP